MRREIEGSGRPEEIPATEIVVLHDADAERSLVILFFESEDDYRRGDEALNAMPADETPGRRSSVTKYDVAIRMTGQAGSSSRRPRRCRLSASRRPPPTRRRPSAPPTRTAAAA
jgi:hypothetical protein